METVHMATTNLSSSERRFVSPNPAALIKRLDRKIDANRSELFRREKPRRGSWRSVGTAWERQPELHRRERNLFWLRGEFQIQLSIIEADRAARAARSARLPKPKPCKA